MAGIAINCDQRKLIVPSSMLDGVADVFVTAEYPDGSVEKGYDGQGVEQGSDLEFDLPSRAKSTNGCVVLVEALPPQSTEETEEEDEALWNERVPVCGIKESLGWYGIAAALFFVSVYGLLANTIL